KFDLINGGTLEDVIDELNNGTLRVGIHIIGLPDGSSESAILVPEPATMCLLGLGALGLLKKRRA
ncbi:MAG: PEP-CTERM sorting domain-containing protein, partial [Planctomycetota bacterium]